MLAPVTHILSKTNIRRERLLPVPGRVLVRTGQKVVATEVIAEARQSASHLILDIGRGLGLPTDQAEKHLTRKVGEQVKKGDVIAGPVGVFSRSVRAPLDGRIAAIIGGEVFLEQEGALIELAAGITGIVTDLVAERGAVIETSGALVQGVWGNDRIDLGLLTNLMGAPEDDLTPDRLDVSMRGFVVVGGSCSQVETLKLAAQIPLRGLILSSLASDLIAEAKKSPVAIVVIEGFGKLPMNHLAYEILSKSDKQEVVVKASAWNRDTDERPEVIVASPSGEPAPDESRTSTGGMLVPGKTVRIVRAPYLTQFGVLVSLRPGLTIFPSGLQTPAAVVRLANSVQVDVPLANLEVVE